MDTNEYRKFLSEEIENLTRFIIYPERGEIPLSTALLVCEKNRLIDKLYELEYKTAPVALKIDGNVVNPAEINRPE